MRDMAVELCGLTFKNPVITASGTFGLGTEYMRTFDLSKLGGIGVKSITPEERQGNDAPRIAETPSGMINAVGLQNPGVDAFVRYAVPQLETIDTNIVVNVAGRTIEDYVEVVQKLEGTGVHMLEINVSCPNVKTGAMQLGTDAKVVKQLVALLKSVSSKPMIVKLSPNVTDIVEIALAAQEGGADGVSLINTLIGMAIDPYSRRPILANVSGGLSGPAIKPVALRMVHLVAEAVDIPVVGMGGIMSGTDVAEFLLCGASAVMVGSANLVQPTACLRILQEFDEYLEKTGATVQELIGALKV